MQAVPSPVTMISSSGRRSNSASAKQYGFTRRGRRPVLGQHDGIARLPLAAPREPALVAPGAAATRRWLEAAAAAVAATSAWIGQVDRERRLGQLGRVDVDHHLVAARAKCCHA